jgi:hypothetical protein
MKNMCKSILVFLSLALTGGCATSGYWADRARDGADVFSFAVGQGLGLKARIGPVTAGLLEEYTAAGLRGGEFCSQALFDKATDYQTLGAIDSQFIIDNAERFKLATLERRKNFEASSLGGGLHIPLLSLLQSDSSFAYYTHIEAVLGLHGSVRVGFNAGEFFDFIIGWTTIDILHDDSAAK